jgi:hypothetical protein
VGTAIGAVLAVGAYAAFARAAPLGLTGGSAVGLWYGVGGTALMVYAGLLSAHRRLARWPLLPRRAWLLKGHIWLGLLSFVLILCHSGFRWGGPLEQVLWVVLGLTLLTGLVGLALQHILPRLLTLRFAEETPYEQMPHVCQVLTRRAEAIVTGVCGPAAAAADPADARAQLRGYYETVVRPFLTGPGSHPSPLHDPAQAEAAFGRLRGMSGLAHEAEPLRTLEALCTQRRQIAEQERMHHWLHGWLLLHIPLSVALLVLGAAHIIVSLYY